MTMAPMGGAAPMGVLLAASQANAKVAPIGQQSAVLLAMLLLGACCCCICIVQWRTLRRRRGDDGESEQEPGPLGGGGGGGYGVRITGVIEMGYLDIWARG